MPSVFAGKLCTISVAYQLQAILEEQDVRKSINLQRAEFEKWRIYRPGGKDRRWIVTEANPGPRIAVIEYFQTRLAAKLWVEEIAMRKAVTVAIDAMFNKGQAPDEGDVPQGATP